MEMVKRIVPLLWLLLAVSCVGPGAGVYNPIELIPHRRTMTFLRYRTTVKKTALEYANEMCYALRQRKEEAYVVNLRDEALVCLGNFALSPTRFVQFRKGPDKTGRIYEARTYANIQADRWRSEARRAGQPIPVEVFDLGEEAWVCAGAQTIKEARRALKALESARRLQGELYASRSRSSSQWRGPTLGSGTTGRAEIRLLPTDHLIDRARKIREGR